MSKNAAASSDNGALTSTTDLSPEELEVVMEMRIRKANKAAAEVFRSKAIATAHAFDKWSSECGDGLTFSTFVDTFGYQDTDCQAMYEAVQRINRAAGPNE